MKRSLTYVEIDIDYCSLTYGSAPCTASIPTTGAIKCFNSLGTCQDRENFANAPKTYRFAQDVGYLPADIECDPCIIGVSVNPAIISLGKSLGERASVTVTMSDYRHSDTGIDKYLSDRSYDPFKQGTFFGKFRSRNPFLRGRNLRVITGFLGDALVDMTTRHYVIESFNGPDPAGNYTIVAKDILKLADDDRAQAPALSKGYLSADILAAATSCLLSPEGVGPLEYPYYGTVAIGGKEVCRYIRDPGSSSPEVSLLLKCNGTNGSTTFTDSSPTPKVVTALGNAQLSTTTPKFGTAACLLDGVDDYLRLDGSSAFAFGTGDFTIDFWFRLTTLGVARTLFDFRPTGTNGAYPTIQISSTNFLLYYTNSATRITGGTAITANVWHHAALSRKDGITRLFLNGIQQGGAYADTSDYLVGTSRPVIGTDGFNVAINEHVGGFDEIRVVKGVGVFTLPFTPPTTEYTSGSADRLYLTRALYETTASDHKTDDRVQLCLLYTSMDPALIVQDLLENYANIDPAYIDIDAWLIETTNYLQRVYTTIIAEPVGVNTLLSELAEQAAMAIWWDEIQRKIRLQVLRPIPTDAALFDESIILEGTTSIKEQPNSRISEAWTFFGQRNPLEKIDEIKNYRSVIATVDLQSSSDYGTSQVRRIFSRWIPAFGRAIASRLNEIILARFRDPPRKFTFDLFQGNSNDITPGGGYKITNWSLQDATGVQVQAPIQVTRLLKGPDIISAEAEEMLFKGFAYDDTGNHIIIIDSDTLLFNLRDVHDTLYAEITDPTGITVTCIIDDGVIVGSPLNSLPAFDVGSWVAGLTINIQVRGRIQGAGGAGGSMSGGVPGNGSIGGPALYTRYPINLDVDEGEIWGGGGGGGAAKNTGASTGFGGGGGAGKNIGTSGIGDGGITSYGNSGTTEAGGLGGGGGMPFVRIGGAGGNPGFAGSSGTGSGSNGTGGAAGAAIDGISYVTVTEGPGDRRGSEIN